MRSFVDHRGPDTYKHARGVALVIFFDLKKKALCSNERNELAGVASGEFDRVFIERRGQDPRPDCPALYVTTNQVRQQALALVPQNAAGHVPILS